MNCPECNAEIPWSADELEDGEVITCDECDATLEVVLLAGGGIAFYLVEDFDDVPDEGEIEW